MWLVISNRTRAVRSFDFEITRMISDQIALHSVQLPLLIISVKSKISKKYYAYIYTDTNLAVNHLSLTAKFLSVYSKKHKSGS